jgi:hypothetical protein
MENDGNPLGSDGFFYSQYKILHLVKLAGYARVILISSNLSVMENQKEKNGKQISL